MLQNFQEYMKAVQKNGYMPNFWMSEEYVQRSGWRFVSGKNLSGVVDENDFWMFPPFNEKENTLDVIQPVYSSFSINPLDEKSILKVSGNNKFVLDRQYIYNPKDFWSLEGSKWAVFRKNIRKFQIRFWETLGYRLLEKGDEEKRIEQMFLAWGEGKELYDVELFTDYLFHGYHRGGLFYKNQLIGLNVWDKNETYLNFRFCLDDGTPYLNEYLRWVFYTNTIIHGEGQFVNDGGDLDNENLRRFKLKLNPFAVHLVFGCGGE